MLKKCLVNSKMSSSRLVWPLQEPKNHAGREVRFLESSTHLGCVYIAVYRIVWMLLRRVAIYNGSISPKSQCQILHILIHHYYISYSHLLAKGFFFKFNVTEIFLPCTMRQHPEEYFNTKRTIALFLFLRLILHAEQKPVKA